jgi:multidrug resistance protein, MATE family
MYYGLASMATGFGVHLICIFIFYYKLQMGFTGICWATALHFLARFLVSFLLMMYSNHWKTFDDLSFVSAETFSNLGQQISIGLKATAMSCWGWWAFEILTLMASYLTDDALAAQVCLRSLGLLTFMLPAGWGNATSTMIGNKLGEKNLKDAKIYYKAGVLNCFIM